MGICPRTNMQWTKWPLAVLRMPPSDRFEIKIDADNDGTLTREEFMHAYTKDIELFNSLAGLTAKVQALQRKIDHSLALASKVTTGTNQDKQHEISRKCAG